MNTIYDAYLKFPRRDCGFCGNTSCIAALRRYCSGQMGLEECLFFRTGAFSPDSVRCPPSKKFDVAPGISYVNPCPSDSSRVTVEVSLATELHSKHGYYDMVTLDNIFGKSTPTLKVSPSLGITRMEDDGRAIMAFSEGRMLIRRASGQDDAFWQLSRSIRQLWAAVN